MPMRKERKTTFHIKLPLQALLRNSILLYVFCWWYASNTTATSKKSKRLFQRPSFLPHSQWEDGVTQVAVGSNMWQGYAPVRQPTPRTAFVDFRMPGPQNIEDGCSHSIEILFQLTICLAYALNRCWRRGRVRLFAISESLVRGCGNVATSSCVRVYIFHTWANMVQLL